MRQLLETVLHGGTLEETLDRCLEQLLATSWLAVLPRGGIHLMAEDGQGLRLAVSRNLTPGVLTQCAHLPLGHCLCGKAAASAKIAFADRVNALHDVTYPGMADHGHYCVPMLNQKEVIGVLVLYLPAGAVRDPSHEEFLVAVTDVLATFVLRQRGDMLLREARAELEGHRLHLEDLVAERTAALAHSEARTRSILSNMLDGVIQIDTRGTILVANEAVPRMFGYADVADLIGQNVNVLMPEPIRSEHDGYLARYLRTRRSTIIGQRREVTGRRKDGTLFPLELATNELADETGVTFIGMVTDITDRKDAESAREAARAEAERLARAKGEFLANMSHEIRTPLNAVLGLAQIGMRENKGRRTGETCERILDAGRHLLGVINDILDFSKMEAGKLAIETRSLALAAVTDQIVSLLVDSAAAKGLALRLELADDLPDWVAGDALRLNQMLVNLRRQRHQVHRDRRNPPRRDTRWRPHLVPRDRYRDRPERGADRASLRPLRTGGRVHHPPAWRHRSGPGHQPPARPPDGRRHRGKQRLWSGQCLYPAPAHADRRAARAARGITAGDRPAAGRPAHTRGRGRGDQPA